MGITAAEIRRVEFRERLRGYHQGDVDEFLERVAAAVEEAEARLGAGPPPSRTEAPPPRPEAPAAQPEAPEAPEVAPRGPGAPGSEQSLRRTLELAQRAADLAVQEARDQGAAIVAAAEARGAELVADAHEEVRVFTEDRQREVLAEVARLEAARDQLRAELDALARVVDAERERGRAWLAGVADAIERPAPPPAAADAAGEGVPDLPR